ncbi:MAG: hypothetical protein SPH68_03585 [Candidatus Borkfalkiaceae bacterium]|nr:hypothetical protein [Clostridia bacterium]MDY6223228.1 hypothetical protein [Christensenellaceae bacterium]
MKYTRASLKYIFGNFGYLILFGMIPAAFLAYSLDVQAIERVLRHYVSGAAYKGFSDIFHAVSIINFRSFSAVAAQVTGVVVCVLCVAMMLAFMEKHMRIGKRTWNGLFSKLNDNLLSTLGITLLFAVIYELWALIASALLLCVSFIANRAAVCILSAAILFAMQAVLLYVISAFYLWLPCLQITGFRSFEALRYSYQLVTGVQGKIVRSQFLSVAIAETALGAACVFVSSFWAVFAIAAVVFTFLILLFVTRMQVVYFDCAQIERADLKTYYGE